ncbi:hypothetical protein [Sphingomonas sp. PB4P5]|uniref:hypothetical protein n=1 Tax=Parasphingomonas puruogangriensis TaxID=3096155 RepID=UPI002FC60DA2
MTDSSDPAARAAADPSAAALPATPQSGAPPPARDAHGFDPNEFEWRPVARRPRSDGWTSEVQRAFIDALADTGLVSAAAQAVNMSVQSCYRLRRAAGSESFAAAWHAALAAAAERVLDIAFERAIQGEDVPVFKDGQRVGSVTRYNDRMAMFIMRAYLPDRFRFAHDDVRRGHEPLPRPEPTVAEAAHKLAPVTPAAPQLLTPPDIMDDYIAGARGVAEVYADYPLDTPEPYVWPRQDETRWAASAPRQTEPEAPSDGPRWQDYVEPSGPPSDAEYGDVADDDLDDDDLDDDALDDADLDADKD